ncbi:MAG: molecular chaperone HtpG [Planctomycetota bacterium]|jgi:molecular chaperone HtpG
MNAAPESQTFKAEVQELLDLMIHSLYTHEEIFLRELVSNASDALDKLRFEALTESGLYDESDELSVQLECDEENRVLSVSDNGIGMSREDLVQNLGTIASSGTKRFLKDLRERGEEKSPELIGQFGVGFYSGFMVADRMVVETRKAGEDQGWRWSSAADGTFTIEECEGLERGTRINLHLKELGDDGTDFCQDAKLRELVQRYSDFVEYPVKIGDDTLNSMKPMWTRAKSEVSEEEHAEFYKHLTHDFTPPLSTIHFRAEGTLEFTALLYIPSQRPFDLFGGEQQTKSQVALYVKRVQVSAECEELLPPWLRFVRGVVESSDLPLNVSREILQSNPHVRAIQKVLTKKVISTLEALLEKNREDYESFWTSFGPVLKEGICSGGNTDERLSKLCLFQTDTTEGWSTLDEYLARCPEDQDAIYYVSGNDRATLGATPHLEAFKKRNFEVIFLTDPIDEWLIDSLTEYGGRSLNSVHAADIGLDSEDDLKKSAEEHADFLKSLGEHFGAGISEVRLTSRLTDSPGVLVSERGAPRPNMERMMKEMHGNDGGGARILEINAGHPLIASMLKMHSAEGSSDRLNDYADLLHGQVLLAEGSNLSDPARFSRLVSDLMVKVGD